MRNFVEIAPRELVPVASFTMNIPVNFGKLTEAIRDVMGDYLKENKIEESIPEKVGAHVRLSTGTVFAVQIGDSNWSIRCANKHYFVLFYKITNWEHSEIKEEKPGFKYNEKTGDFDSFGRV